MTADNVYLDRQRLELLFTELNTELGSTGERAELYVVGGARMACGLTDDRVTTDVDAVFRSGGDAVKRAAERLR